MDENIGYWQILILNTSNWSNTQCLAALNVNLWHEIVETKSEHIKNFRVKL